VDFTSLLEKAVPTLLSGAGSAAGFVWRFTHALSARVASLENSLEGVKLAIASAQIEVENNHKKLHGDLATLHQVLTVIRKDMDSETEDIYGTLRIRAKEQADLRRIFTRLTERYIGLEARLEQAEAAINNMNDSLKDFMKGQQEQWQTTSKSLGQIEGYIRGISRRTTSGSFPPVK
jgi:chromosome segregation ATPase